MTSRVVRHEGWVIYLEQDMLTERWRIHKIECWEGGTLTDAEWQSILAVLPEDCDRPPPEDFDVRDRPLVFLPGYYAMFTYLENES